MIPPDVRVAEEVAGLASSCSDAASIAQPKRSADISTSDGYYGGRVKDFLQGVLTFVVMFVVIPLVIGIITVYLGRLRKRRADGSAPAKIWPVLLMGTGAVVALMLGLAMLAHPALYAVGLTETVAVRVTGTTSPSYYDDTLHSGTISGEFALDGQRRHLESAEWPVGVPLPEKDAVVDVAISPLWPYPTFTAGEVGLRNALLGGALTALGVFLAYGAAQFARRKGQIAPH